MKKFCKTSLIAMILLASQGSTEALEVLFPQKNPYTTSSGVTYIMGNVHKGASLTINGKPSKVWHNGAFCESFPLAEGLNTFVLKENFSKNSEEKTIKITKPSPIKSDNQNTKYVPPKQKIFDNLMYAKVVTDGAPVRTKASTSSDRVTHLPENTIILIEKQVGDWYKINVGKSSEQLWIYSKNAKIMYPVNNRITVSARQAKVFEDELFSYLKINLDLPVAYKIKESGNFVNLTLFGIKDINPLCEEINNQKVFGSIDATKDDGDNLTISFNLSDGIWGYDAEYQGSSLVFKVRKKPIINVRRPLSGITVAVDAGHGGNEKGTVGPTKIPEKDVNLAISKFLKTELEKRGANVVMTREEDVFTELYERPKIANNANALICLSIHSNSMVDGNPFEKNGTSVFYYNNHAKKLADTIKLQMLKDLKLRDDGTRYSSFVLTRPTMPVSVLIEVGYMPNPDEYLKLTSRYFQHKTARSIAEGLENHLRASIEQ